MAKPRVYDLAKEFNVDNKDILAELERAGVTGKTPSSGLDDNHIKLLRDKFGKAKEKPVKPEVLKLGSRPSGAVKIKSAPSAPSSDEEARPAAAKKVEKTEMEKPAPTSRFGGFFKHRNTTAVATGPGVGTAEIIKPKIEVKPSEQPPVEEKIETAAPSVTSVPAVPVQETKAHEVKAPEEPMTAEVKTVEPAVQEPPKAPPVAEAPPRPVVSQEMLDRLAADALRKKEGAPSQRRPSHPAPQQQTPAQKEQAAKEALAKLKKSKGPKPVRTEVEVMDGVDKVPTISSKLKNRLQTVKKKPAGPDTAFPKKEGSGPQKWQDFRGSKKRGQKQDFRTHQKHQAPSAAAAAVEDIASTVARKKAVKITEGITVKDFADKIGVKSGDVIKKLFEMGMMATINNAIDTDAAVLLADQYGLKVDVTPITDEEAFVEEEQDRPEDLRPRPPIVTIMGHVDHGKTSLLDAIRQTSVTKDEAGGITQHIGAYRVRLNDKDIVFLDTPGHEAFTAMRARGAQVTDIVVLVVAAEDGVRPQTLEAINHSKAAKVPIIVAINKIDKPEADQDRVKRELSDQGLVPEDWGGDTIFVPVSAKKRIGIESLLEMILLQADVMELKANPNKPGHGTIIEAKLDKGRGPVATVLVSTGTIRPGDVFVTGQHSGRIRMLLNDKGKKEKEATPSYPVEVIGLSGVPQAGDSFVVMEDEKKARQVAQSRMQKVREAELALHKRVTLDDLFSQIQKGEVKELNIIIKADVQGSVEAVSESLTKLSTEAVKLNVIHGSVGAITESDVMLASASNAIIIGFNIRPEPKASQLAEAEGVDVRLYNIIYNAIDEVRLAMEGLLEPTLKEKVLGRAEVRQTFSVPKIGLIAGCYVLDGVITRGSAGVRVLRDNVVIFEGKLSSLKRFKEDVREVQTGYECGIGVENFNDIKVGDVIEAYDVEKLATKL
ncbi:MAG: translation initiation factor IF-2 [Nitrospirota bacterium]